MLVEWIVHLIFHYKSCILIGWYINTSYLSAHTLWAEAIKLFSLCELACESSLHRQPFKSVQKSGQINLKNGLFPVLDQFRTLRESCASLAQQIRVVAIFLFPRNSHHLTTDLTINIIILLANRVMNFLHARQKIEKLSPLFTHQLTQQKCSLCSQGSQLMK